MIGCEKCGHTRSHVLETRDSNRCGLAHPFLRRQRECLNCGHRWYTYEVPASLIDEKPSSEIAKTIKKRMKKNMSAIVLDTETTGLDKEKDRVVEIGIISFQDGSVLMNQLVNPCMSIPSEVTMIHGIGDEHVRNCPVFAEIAHRVKNLIEEADAVIGYHVFYDYGMLNAEFARLGIEVRWPTLVCAKRVWEAHEPKERTLQNAYRRFVDRRGFDKAHSALADIQATREVLIAQISAFGLDGKPWDQFDPERSLWWGPSPHILMRDGDLVVNFGKHAGKLVVEVDTGFWKWVSTKDFPDHVSLLALEMIWADELGLEEKRKKITSWALDYKSRKFSQNEVLYTP